EDGEAVDLLDDVADVERRRRRAAVDDGAAMCPQVIRRDLREKPLAPRRQKLTLEDRPAHGPRAVGHRRHGEPFLTELAEALRLEKAPLGALLFKGGRAPLPDHALGVDAEFSRSAISSPAFPAIWRPGSPRTCSTWVFASGEQCAGLIMRAGTRRSRSAMAIALPDEAR